ncbi:MAG: DUF4340 domain-containing protein [Akkermansiaceae bacterium]|nr:DUF4340 domain-containing protein [Akkermansiaceae bacterium]NNM30916.1 DUF4340 domain-containing protein [Akkermansiaceae bacterium]
MNKKQVIFLWVIAAALAVAVAAVKSAQNRGTASVTERSRGEKLLPEFPAGKVAAVTIEGADGAVNLKQSGDGWVVEERENYPANFQLLGSTLRTLTEVEVTQGLEAGPSYNPRFGMDRDAAAPEDHGLHLTFKDAAGANLESLALGKETQSDANSNPMMMMQSAGGRFVRLASDPKAIYVISESFPRVTADPKDWLKDEFVKIEKIKSITLRAPEDSGFAPWTLTRTAEIGDFTLEDMPEGKQINVTAVNPLKNFFSFARFEDVVPAGEAAKQSDPAQKRQAVITTFDGFTYTLDIVPKKSPVPAREGAPTPPQNYFLTVKVEATLPTERSKPAEETEEEAKSRDEAFQQRLKDLEKKLATEQRFAGRTFEVTQWTVNALLKPRADLIQDKGTTPGQGVGGRATSPPFQLPPQGIPGR